MFAAVGLLISMILTTLAMQHDLKQMDSRSPSTQQSAPGPAQPEAHQSQPDASQSQMQSPDSGQVVDPNASQPADGSTYSAPDAANTVPESPNVNSYGTPGP